jgi:hypothetical protein
MNLLRACNGRRAFSQWDLHGPRMAYHKPYYKARHLYSLSPCKTLFFCLILRICADTRGIGHLYSPAFGNTLPLSLAAIQVLPGHLDKNKAGPETGILKEEKALLEIVYFFSCLIGYLTE